MENQSGHDLEERFAAARACLEGLCPPAERTRRAAVVTDAVRQLADYRAYLSEIDRVRDGADPCLGLRGPVRERAFDAESQGRILLAEGLRSLNDMRDSGMLHVGLAQFAQALDSGKGDVRHMLEESAKELQQEFKLPPTFADEMLQAVERRQVTIRHDADSNMLVVRALGADGDMEETKIRLTPRAGDLGRISVERFFGTVDRVSIQPGPFSPQRGDCHSRTGQLERPQSIDVYAGMLGIFAAGRETLYRHARKVGQYGHGTTIRARDPGIAAGVAAMVGAVMAIVGAALSATFGGVGTTVGRLAFFIAIAGVAILLLSLVVLLFLI